MPDINLNFKSLRVNFRKHGIEISENVFHRFHPATLNIGDEICVFCKSTFNLTKEHVFPKWLFEKNTNIRFISSVNRQSQTYNKAVIPTCSDCNNDTLAEIEKHIIKILDVLDSNPKIFTDELEDIIRWLEILDYKTQVYDCRRKYIKYDDSEYDPFWGILPLAHMRHFMEMNPFKALDYLRRSQRRITVKSKDNRLNSLIFFRTSRPHFDFFCQPDEYIYVSFPMYKMAVFYFLRKEFDNVKDAGKEALYYIDQVSKS